MKYTVTDKGTEYCVLEKPSGLTVYYTGTQELATRMVELLNNGAGFDGNTPTFFADKKMTLSLVK